MLLGNNSWLFQNFKHHFTSLREDLIHLEMLLFISRGLIMLIKYEFNFCQIPCLCLSIIKILVFALKGPGLGKDTVYTKGMCGEEERCRACAVWVLGERIERGRRKIDGVFFFWGGWVCMLWEHLESYLYLLATCKWGSFALKESVEDCNFKYGKSPNN